MRVCIFFYNYSIMATARNDMRPTEEDMRPFTVHIKTMVGEEILIENMRGTNLVLFLKNRIIEKLADQEMSKKADEIILTIMDDSEENGYKTLEDNYKLADYKINENSEVNLVVLTLPVRAAEAQKLYTQYLKDSNSLDEVPENVTVVSKLTAGMEGSTIYILQKKGDKKGLKCQIEKVGPIVPYRMKTLPPVQMIDIHVIKNNITLRLDANFGDFFSARALGRIFLEVPVAEDRVEGGKRRKRSRKTKRALCRRRRTHRK